MNNLTQLAINIPEVDFNEILKFSKKSGLSVDEVILEALRFWKNESLNGGNIEHYMDSYKRMPENLKDNEAWEKASLASFENDEW